MAVVHVLALLCLSRAWDENAGGAGAPDAMVLRIGQILAVVGVLPVATIGFASGRALCLHVHGGHSSHMHLIEQAALDTWTDERGDCHTHEDHHGTSSESGQDALSDPVKADECLGTLIRLNDPTTTTPASRTIITRCLRPAGPAGPVTVDGLANIAATNVSLSWQWGGCVPGAPKTVDAILRSSHALLL